MSPTDLLQDFLSSCSYNYLGSKAGIVIGNLFADACAGTRHHDSGASEGLWEKRVKCEVKTARLLSTLKWSFLMS